jgi:hypothetical protein
MSEWGSGEWVAFVWFVIILLAVLSKPYSSWPDLVQP